MPKVRKFAGSSYSNGKRDRKKPLEFSGTLRTFLESLEESYPKSNFIGQRTAAKTGSVPDGYIFYSVLSNDAAHPSATSLSRHVTMDNERSKSFTLHAAPGSTSTEISETLEFACGALLGVCVAANELLGGTPAGKELATLFDEFNALSAASKTLEGPSSEPN